MSSQIAHSAKRKADAAKNLRDEGNGLVTGDHPRKGQPKTSQGQEPVVNPSTVFLDDGTRLDFRTDSKSGGYTIDINNNVNSKIFKIHVNRPGS